MVEYKNRGTAIIWGGQACSLDHRPQTTDHGPQTTALTRGLGCREPMSLPARMPQMRRPAYQDGLVSGVVRSL